MATNKTTVILALLVIIAIGSIHLSLAQVNFSPSWGKRTAAILANSNSEDVSNIVENCKVPLDSVVRIQKLIQLEAHKLIRCESMAGEIQRRK